MASHGSVAAEPIEDRLGDAAQRAADRAEQATTAAAAAADGAGRRDRNRAVEARAARAAATGDRHVRGGGTGVVQDEPAHHGAEREHGTHGDTAKGASSLRVVRFALVAFATQQFTDRDGSLVHAAAEATESSRTHCPYLRVVDPTAPGSLFRGRYLRTVDFIAP